MRSRKRTAMDILYLAVSAALIAYGILVVFIGTFEFYTETRPGFILKMIGFTGIWLWIRHERRSLDERESARTDSGIARAEEPRR